MPNRPPKAPADAALWVVVCAFCSCAGWVLSALHWLNAFGYLVAFALAGFALWIARKVQPRFGIGMSPTPSRRSEVQGRVTEAVKTAEEMDAGGRHRAKAPVLIRGLDFSCWDLRKLQRRARRLFPLGFFALAALAFLGGLLYAPSNYDALAYRTPRVLHWLAEDRWHWIHTDFARLNVRTCGMEWMSAPLLALTRTDRGLFLISAVSFLLLPGRVFSLLTHFGVRGRVAWYWMWLLPTGYCFLLQAGSIGNDLFGAVLAMLAIEFALRAGKTGRLSEVYLAILAAALMTAGKAFNALLLLPWGLAMLPNLRLLFSRPLMLIPVGLVAAACSLIPTALLNIHFCGDWSGMKLEQTANLANGSRVFHVAVNAVLLCLYNFVPPVFPWANQWNSLMDRVIPPDLAARLQQNFEGFAAHFRVGEMEMEESAGLGMCVSLLLLIWGGHRLTTRNRGRGRFNPDLLIPLGAAIAMLVLISQSGLACPARYLAPFYVLLVTPLLAHVPASAIRYPWWRSAGIAVFLVAALLVVISPPRPLWPAQTILRAFGADYSTHALVRRAWTVYSVYGRRGDAFAEAKAVLPPDANPLGLVTSDDPETSLWRPFGQRRIIHICKSDTAETVRAAGLRYALVSSVVLNTCQTPLDDWLARFDAEVMQKMNLELRASAGPKEWYLVRFKTPNSQAAAKQ
jgi:hypothetical protein